MNKVYLKSLGGYLVFNSVFYVMLSIMMSTPITTLNFFSSTIFAIVLHKFFIWKG